MLKCASERICQCQSVEGEMEKCRKNITPWKLQGIWGMLGQEIERVGRESFTSFRVMCGEKGFAGGYR